MPRVKQKNVLAKPLKLLKPQKVPIKTRLGITSVFSKSRFFLLLFLAGDG